MTAAAVALTLSLIFFIAVAQAERTDGDSRLLRPILAIIALLLLAMGLVGHEMIIASWPQWPMSWG